MRCKMKHTDEVQAILTAIFAINRTSAHEDKDITLVLDYAFRRLFKTKEQMMPEVREMLKIYTQYEKYLEE